MSNNEAKIKTRNWCFIVYPESADPDWRTKLKSTGVPGFISPLHDKDKEADGKLKKAHWHANLFFKGPTSLLAVKALTAELKATNPQRIWDPLASYEYATHKNAPDKYQYPEADIDVFNGFDIAKYQGDKTDGEKLALSRKVNQIIIEKGIFEYSELVRYLEDKNENDLIDAVMRNPYHYGRLLDSLRHSVEWAALAAHQKAALKREILEVMEEIKNNVQ